MRGENRLTALLPALLGVALVVVIISSMLMLPFEKPSSTAANDFGNVMNGGYVAVDGTMSYYVDGGVLHCRSEYSDYRLGDGPCDSVNPSGSYVFFRDNGAIVRDLFNGGERKVIAEQSGHILVSGNWLYYTDADSQLKKQRLSGGKVSSLGITTDKQFAVVGTYVYYIAEDGRLYCARTDGSEQQSFLAEKIDCFQIYGSFICFISDGRVGSVASGNMASRKDYGEADEFITFDDSLITVVDGRLYMLDLTDNSAEPKAIVQQGEEPHGLNTDGEKLYYYNSAGELISDKPTVA